MDKSKITVTMPLEEYEDLKDEANWQRTKYKDLFNEIHKHIDINENGKATRVDIDGLLGFLIMHLYEVDYNI